MHTEEQQGIATDFEFRGSASEFFGIWIVNLLLSIVTLGIYSAWAKVRTKKYFYQNTYVAGRSFDYHATGKQILIGRLIVIAGIIAYAVLAIIPLLNLLMILGLLFLIPYLLVRSLRFNARMSSWSNVRFAFHGTTGQAASNYFLYPIIAGLTLYTTWPFVTRAVQRFHVSGHTFGKTPMHFDAPIGPFYKAAFAALAWSAVAIIGIFQVLGSGLPVLSLFDGIESGINNLSEVFTVFVMIAAYLLVLVPAAIIYHSMVRNTVYNYTILGKGHRFYSDVSPLRMLWISVTNLVVIVLTLGLMLPWAHVRRVRYLASHTTFVAGGPLDEFIDDVTAEVSAIGDAYGDIEGFDIGIAV